ncbi:hypothetical protein Nepgr_014187 [Nepenthes gracilis]|uniref:H(+)-exporting diphosphatase n=1 Tax=Nepenthes gracilis TaxID=150966 RepID=A0AAD3XQ22_NEPGR|nr:hypothetical protein Nepgr_014187 [Nepenthes gracilis]
MNIAEKLKARQEFPPEKFVKTWKVVEQRNGSKDFVTSKDTIFLALRTYHLTLAGALFLYALLFNNIVTLEAYLPNNEKQQRMILSFQPLTMTFHNINYLVEMPKAIKTKGVVDAAGNTISATGKGFVISSTALMFLALFAALASRAPLSTILRSKVFTSLIVGAMFPYGSLAMTIKSIGSAA